MSTLAPASPHVAPDEPRPAARSTRCICPSRIGYARVHDLGMEVYQQQERQRIALGDKCPCLWRAQR